MTKQDLMLILEALIFSKSYNFPEAIERHTQAMQVTIAELKERAKTDG